MDEFYYCRHGQTVDLTTGHRSRCDTELTRKGLNEASKAGRLLLRRKITPSLIVSSKLIRARQSADAIARVLGYDISHIKSLELLNERRWGEAEGVLNTEIKDRWPGGFDTVPGAETVEALQERAFRAVDELQGLDAGVVLVVGHGTIGRAIRRVLEKRKIADEYSGERGDLKNGEVVRLFPQPTMTLDS